MRVAGGNQGGARDTRDGEEDEERVLGDELENVAVEGVLDGEDETDLLLNRRSREREDRTKGQRRGRFLDSAFVGGGKRRRGKVALFYPRTGARRDLARRVGARVASRCDAAVEDGWGHAIGRWIRRDGTWGMYAPRDGR